MKTAEQTSDVLIAGAGIIGLSAALELAQSGLSVTVLDQRSPMQEASWAAAGMLAAQDPENPPELQPLAGLSLALYPGFLAQVESLSGLRVPLRTGATAQALHPGNRLPALSPELLRQRVPGCVPGERRFTWLDEASLDPRDLVRALPLAAHAAGVVLLENTAVTSIGFPGGASASNRVQVQVSGPKAKPLQLTARFYLHCCGAWAAIPHLSSCASPPVEPRKGQMLTVTMPRDALSLRAVLRTPELYLVPRGDGRILVGATIEHSGFDRTLTQSAAESLFAAAAALWPPLRYGAITDHWAGLRPATPDGLPILGPLADLAFASPAGEVSAPSSARHWIATGHFRNGILLAPGTARILCQLVLGQPTAIDLRPFRAARFAALPSLHC